MPSKENATVRHAVEPMGEPVGRPEGLAAPAASSGAGPNRAPTPAPRHTPRRLGSLRTLIAVLLFIVASLALPAQAQAAASNPVLDISRGTIFLDEGRYAQMRGAVTSPDDSEWVAYDGTLTITGTSTYWYSIIAVGGTSDVVFKDLTIKPVSTDDAKTLRRALRVDSGASLNVTLEGSNLLKGGANMVTVTSAMDGVLLNQGASLTIRGEGTLAIEGGDPVVSTGYGYTGVTMRTDSSLRIADDAVVSIAGGYRNASAVGRRGVGIACLSTGDGSVSVDGAELTVSGSVGIEGNSDGFTFEQSGGSVKIEGDSAGFQGGSLSLSEGAHFEVYSTEEDTIALLEVDITVSGGSELLVNVSSGFAAGWCSVALGTEEPSGPACYFYGSGPTSIDVFEALGEEGVEDLTIYDSGYFCIRALAEGEDASGRFDVMDRDDRLILKRYEGLEPGDRVQFGLVEDPGEEWTFDRWELVAGEGSIADPRSAGTEFLYLFGDGAVRPVFTRNYKLSIEGAGADASANGRYVPGRKVSILAEERVSNMLFDHWEVEGAGSVANATSRTTTFTAGEGDATARAVYVQGYSLTVENGSGTGLYKAGQKVTIKIAMPSGTEFGSWEVESGEGDIADASAASTTFTVGASDAIVRAVPAELDGEDIILDFAVSGGTLGKDYMLTTPDILEFKGTGEYSVRMRNGVASTSSRIRINSSCTVTFDSLTITNQIPVQIYGSSNKDVCIKLAGESKFPSVNKGYAGIQKENDGNLIITSAQGDGSTYGSLTITVGTTSGGGTTPKGDYYGAAIGGNRVHPDANNITIAGGTIIAKAATETNSGTGSTYAGVGAGIGGAGLRVISSSRVGNASNIRVTGGRLDLKTYGGAGIGGGGLDYTYFGSSAAGNATDIEISGGSITARVGNTSGLTPGQAIGAGVKDISSSTDLKQGSASGITVAEGAKVLQGTDSADTLVKDLSTLSGGTASCVDISFPTSITGVAIEPAAAEVNVGERFRLSAAVESTGDKTVTWSVSGNASDATTVSQTGLLTVGADETAEKLTVTATSTFDGTKSASATVTVDRAIGGSAGIGGTAAYGETLAANYSGNAAGALSYQWYCAEAGADGKPTGAWKEISGATGAAYAPGADDIGCLVRVAVAAKGLEGSVESDPVGPIAKAEQPPLSFEGADEDNGLTVAYGDGGTVSLSAIGGAGDGEVTYELVDSGAAEGVAELDGSELTILGAGTVAVRVTKAGDDLYNKTSTELTITIEKGEAPELTGAGANVVCAATGDQVLDLTGQLAGMPEDAGKLTFKASGKAGDEDSSLIASWSVSPEGFLTYELAPGLDLDEYAEVTLNVTVSSKNYGDANLAVTVVILPRITPQVSAEPFTAVYDGEPVGVNELTLLATDAEGNELAGEWAWVDNAPKDAIGTQEKPAAFTLRFTPEDETSYRAVEIEAEVVIKPASLTVTAPSATAVFG